MALPELWRLSRAVLPLRFVYPHGRVYRGALFRPRNRHGVREVRQRQSVGRRVVGPVRCFYIEPAGDALVTFADGSTKIVDCPGGHSGGEMPAECIRHSPRYRRVDTGEVKNAIADFGPGAMWDADWLKDSAHGAHAPYFPPGADGRILCVTLPNGHDWVIDSRASNCTLPRDSDHRCWVRHGSVPQITVDKDGLTCAAGAGSIQSGDYHGFLRNGELVSC